MNNADRSLLRALRNWTREGWPNSDIAPLKSMRLAMQLGDEGEVERIGEAFSTELGDCFATYCACGAIIHDGEGSTSDIGDATCDDCAEKLTRGAK